MIWFGPGQENSAVGVAVVQHYDSFQVRIHQLTPDLTDVGTSLDEAKTLRQEHQDLTTKLYVSIRHKGATYMRQGGHHVGHSPTF